MSRNIVFGQRAGVHIPAPSDGNTKKKFSRAHPQKALREVSPTTNELDLRNGQSESDTELLGCKSSFFHWMF